MDVVLVRVNVHSCICLPDESCKESLRQQSWGSTANVVNAIELLTGQGQSVPSTAAAAACPDHSWPHSSMPPDTDGAPVSPQGRSAPKALPAPAAAFALTSVEHGWSCIVGCQGKLETYGMQGMTAKPQNQCCWLSLDKPAADYMCSINRVLDKGLQV